MPQITFRISANESSSSQSKSEPEPEPESEPEPEPEQTDNALATMSLTQTTPTPTGTGGGNPGGNPPAPPAGPPGGPPPGQPGPIPPAAPLGQNPGTRPEIRINPPSVFDGDPKKARSFKLQCQIYLELNAHVYNTDLKRVFFVLSFCKEGTARIWSETLLNMHHAAGTLPTWQEFEAAFDRNFLTSDMAGEAKAELMCLRQTGTADEYVAQFQIVLQLQSLLTLGFRQFLALCRSLLEL